MEFPELNSTTFIVIVIIGAVLFEIFMRIRPEGKEKKGKINLQIYNLRDSILTKNELAFYQALAKAVNGEQVILSKVRISDIFSVSRGAGTRRRSTGSTPGTLILSFATRIPSSP